MNILDHQVGLARYASPGAWNDPDMLVVGMKAESGPAAVKARGCTDTEYRANMSLWCLLATPLFAACDLRSMSDTTRKTLTNPEILALDQDPLGRAADRSIKDGDIEVWARPLVDGSWAVGLLNRDARATRKIRVQWSDLGIRGGILSVTHGKDAIWACSPVNMKLRLSPMRWWSSSSSPLKRIRERFGKKTETTQRTKWKQSLTLLKAIRVWPCSWPP